MRVIHIDSNNNVLFGTIVGVEAVANNSHHAVKMTVDVTNEVVLCMGMLIPYSNETLSILECCENPWETFKAIKLLFQTIDLIRAVGLNEINSICHSFRETFTKNSGTNHLSL